MGYYMRYFVTDEQLVTAEDVKSVFRAAGPEYHFEVFESEVMLYHGDSLLAHVTFNVPGDGLFQDERDEMLEEAQDGRGAGKRTVLAKLRATRQIVAIQVLHGTGETETTLDLISPLWDWLCAQRAGVGQADAGGFYDGDRLILRVD